MGFVVVSLMGAEKLNPLISLIVLVAAMTLLYANCKLWLLSCDASVELSLSAATAFAALKAAAI